MSLDGGDALLYFAVVQIDPGQRQSRSPPIRAPELRFCGVGVAGFEPTASSSRTRVGRDDQYQQVRSRARGPPRQVLW